MANRVLDTNVLISHQRSFQARRKKTTLKDWETAAKELIDRERTNFILSPVKIEFLAGAISKDELAFFEAYLGQFTCLDEGKIPPNDWIEAERIAKWVRIPGRRRNLGDCLIEVIARRLNADIISRDSGIRPRVNPQ